MASSTIKGITIKLGADASELTQALYEAEKSLSSTQGQLKQVASALKLDPGNVTLLEQKFELLKREINTNEDYIRDLKKAMKGMEEAGVDKTSDEFMTLQRSIITAEKKGERFKSQLNQTEAALNGTETEVKDLSSSLNRVNTDKATSELSAMKVAIGNLISQGINRLTSAISDSLGGAISRVDTLEAYGKTMKNLGYSSGEAAKAQDELVNSVEGLPTKLDEIITEQQKYVALFGDMDKATDVAIALNNATLAAGQGTEKAQQAQEAWYKTLAKGKPEADNWLTITSNMPAQMKALSESLLGTGKTSNDLFAAWQNGTLTTEQITAALVNLNANGASGMSSFAQQALTATGGIQTGLDNMKTAVVKAVANVIQSIGSSNINAAINGITNAIKKAGNAAASIASFVSSHMTVISALAVGIGTVVGLLKAWSIATKAWTTATKLARAAQIAFNAATKANIIGIVITLVVGLAAALVTAYKKSETFRAAVQRIASALAAFVGKIRNVASSIMTTLKNAFSKVTSIGANIVTGIWQGISNKFSWITSLIKGFANNVKEKLKGFFGIHSPSRWARDVIGTNIVLGMAEGINAGAKALDTAMASLVPATAPTLASMSNEMANAVGTGLALQNSGPAGGSYQFVVELGGSRIAEQVFRLNQQGKMIMEG